MTTPENPYRLPRHVVPRRYDVVLTPDLPAATFGGTVRIELDVQEPTDRLVLNAIELEIGEIDVTDGSGRALTEQGSTLDEPTERLTI